MSQRVFTGFNVLFFLMYALSAAVQFNDPDPWPWFVIYAAAAVVCVLGWRRPRGGLIPAIVVGVVALIWAAILAPQIGAELEIGHLFRTMETKTPQIELSREILGLAIIVAWMTVLAISTNWRDRSCRSAAPAR